MSKEIECGIVTLDTPIKIISTDKYQSEISIGEYSILKVRNEDVPAIKTALETAYNLGYSDDASCELLNQNEDE